MSTDHLILLTIPGLRPGDVTLATTPTLHEWANRGVLAELTPTFPCVTSPVQASMLTGTPPGRHGVIANGFFHRDRRSVEFWVAPNSVIAGGQIFDAFRQHRPAVTSAVWHLQNIKGASADYIVTPAPIHEPDGTTKLWCYSKPDDLYNQLLDRLGHFPLQHYWGPLANIESTRWILSAAAWLMDHHRPNFHWIYIPHLDYASQKFGPNSAEARAALVELDGELSRFAGEVAGRSRAKRTVYLVAGEYALTDVSGVIHPNRLLREADLLVVRQGDAQDNGKEHVDLQRSRAFAMVDHQFAHVFVEGSDARTIARCCELLRATPGVAAVHAGDDRRALGMDHERCGDVIVVSDDAHWLAYYWWLDDEAAPAFARTVDIHRKPGYDPVELFWDPATRSIPLDGGLVKGSHGVPATHPRHRTALICSQTCEAVQSDQAYRDTDIKRIIMDLMGVV